MAAIPKKLLALDTNILFDLAQGKDFSHTLREILQERGNALKVPPTVVQELTYFVEKGNSVEKAIALTALTEMRGWGILP
jgi:predicted nucleic acid-binding protein